MFEQMYVGYVHHPWICWAVAAIMFVVVLRRLSFFHAFLLGALALTFTDAMVTGAWFHLGGAEWEYFGPLAFFFVLAGDFRYFLLVHRYAGDFEATSWGGARVWGKAVAWTLVPALVSGALQWGFPDAFAQRWMSYLVYELVMVALASMFLVNILPQMTEGRPESVQRWLKGVTIVELAHYVLWALSDMLILSGVEFGFALRFVPDVIYYAVFIPVVYLLAPKEVVT